MGRECESVDGPNRIVTAVESATAVRTIRHRLTAATDFVDANTHSYCHCHCGGDEVVRRANAVSAPIETNRCVNAPNCCHRLRCCDALDMANRFHHRRCGEVETSSNRKTPIDCDETASETTSDGLEWTATAAVQTMPVGTSNSAAAETAAAAIAIGYCIETIETGGDETMVVSAEAVGVMRRCFHHHHHRRRHHRIHRCCDAVTEHDATIHCLHLHRAWSWEVSSTSAGAAVAIETCADATTTAARTDYCAAAGAATAAAAAGCDGGDASGSGNGSGSDAMSDVNPAVEHSVHLLLHPDCGRFDPSFYFTQMTDTKPQTLNSSFFDFFLFVLLFTPFSSSV